MSDRTRHDAAALAGVDGPTRLWLASATVGGLWVVVVLFSALGSLTPLARVEHAVLPTATPYSWSWAAPWPVLVPVAGAVAAALVHAAILHLGRSRSAFAFTWLATVAAGAAVGLTIDVVLVFGNLFSSGWAAWALDLGSRAAAGAYWGLLYGWIAGLVARRLTRADAEAAATPPHRVGAALVAVAAIASLAVLGAAQIVGDAATQAQIRAEAAAAEPPPADGSAPVDPQAPGDPVPERVDGPGVTGVDACTPDRAMTLIGDPDGATGHRGLRLELMNFSEEPCVIEGYPDVAFGDQNGHLLDVDVAPGSSFMAVDPGPMRIEIPAGASAVAWIGWDANSTHGALVAKTVWGAVLPGETRGSKPIESDIVAGSSVTVTAWALPEITGTAP